MRKTFAIIAGLMILSAGSVWAQDDISPWCINGRFFH